jgi:hypothetical protein
MKSRDLYVATGGTHPVGQAEYTCPLPHIPEAVRTMRHHARTVLGHWAMPTATTDDAILVVSELITNASPPRPTAGRGCRLLPRRCEVCAACLRGA